MNAVRHSGAASVSVYLEVEPQRVSIFVRDRGRGLRSGRGRRRSARDLRLDRRPPRPCRRAGQVRSTPGEGTEVEMSLPRSTEAATT